LTHETSAISAVSPSLRSQLPMNHHPLGNGRPQSL
jgi:hypothetical protein